MEMQFQVKIQCYIRKGVIFLGIFANHSLDSGRITLPASPSLPPPRPHRALYRLTPNFGALWNKKTNALRLEFAAHCNLEVVKINSSRREICVLVR